MIAIKPLRPKRRIFFEGVNTGYTIDGEPDARFVDFYRVRSSPELHCAIVGNVVIPGGYGSNESTPRLSSASVWSDLAAAIVAGGSIPGIQLATAWSGYKGSRKFRSPESRNAIAASRAIVEDLNDAHITRLLDNLESGFKLALSAGFRHVQLHAAHGYLFSLLVDGRIYSQATSFREKLGVMAKVWSGAGVETSIRVSIKTGDSDFDRYAGRSPIDELCKLPFDYVDVSSGFYNVDKRLIYPATPKLIAQRKLDMVALAIMHPRRKFIHSGRAFQSLADDMPENVHIGLCRDLIANPNFLQTQTEGCINSGKCHYFSRGERHITCARWVE